MKRFALFPFVFVLCQSVACSQAPTMTMDDVQAPPNDVPATDAETADEVTPGDGMVAPTDGMGAPTAPTPPATPAAPMVLARTALPSRAMCPMGWRSVSSRTSGMADPTIDYSTCEPYAADDPMNCPTGQANWVGTPGCQPVGDPCTADEWPAGIDALASVIFVNDTAVGVGAGNTRVTAYRTISQALARATVGTTVAVAKGTYDEVITIPNGVIVLGACAAETIIRPTSFGDRAAVSDGVVRAASASTGTLRNFTVNVSGTTLVGLSAYGNRNLSIRGVAVTNAYRFGMLAEGGAMLSGERVTIADTRAGMDGTDGVGLLVLNATARIAGAMVFRSRDAGVAAVGGMLTLTDAAVLGTQSRMSDRSKGYGVVAREGARVSITRSLLDSNDSAGIGGSDAMTSIELSDSVVRRTETSETPRDGFGLFVGPGATANVSRTTFDRNQSVAVIAAGSGANLTLADAVVLRTAPLVDGAYGRGLDVEGGAVATVDRAVFDRNRDNAVFVTDPNTVLMASDLTVLATAAGRASIDGVGAIHVRNSARATIASATLVDNAEGGVHVVGAGTVATVSNLSARSTSAGADSNGNGVDVEDGARLTLDRATLTQNQHVAVFVDGMNTSLAATDLRVMDTRPSVDGERGWGVRVQAGARATIERAVIEGSTEIGVFARDAVTNLRLSDAVIQRTASAADGSEGFGLLVFGGANVGLERAIIAEAHKVAAVVSDTGTLATLTDVRIARTQSANDGTGGWGAAVQRRATLSMTRVAIAESKDVGVLVMDGNLTAQNVSVTGILPRACIARGMCPATANWESALGLVGVNDSRLQLNSVAIDGAARCGLLTSTRPIGSEPSMQSLTFARSAVYRSAIGWCQQLPRSSSDGLYLDSSNGVATEQTRFTPPDFVRFF